MAENDSPSNLKRQQPHVLVQISRLNMRRRGCRRVPRFTVAPISPLVPLFIRSTANLRSACVRKSVDSGRPGKRNKHNTPTSTVGTPYCAFIRTRMKKSKQTHFYDKQQSPVRNGYVDMLNPISEQTTKCTSNGGKTKPRSDSGAVFCFGIIEC